MHTHIDIHIHIHSQDAQGSKCNFYILQRGVQWKQGVVVYLTLGCLIIEYYPHPLHPAPTAPPFDECPGEARRRRVLGGALE